MRIGVPKEIRVGEARVALAPEVIGKLVKQGIEVVIEKDRKSTRLNSSH